MSKFDLQRFSKRKRKKNNRTATHKASNYSDKHEVKTVVRIVAFLGLVILAINNVENTELSVFFLEIVIKLLFDFK